MDTMPMKTSLCARARTPPRRPQAGSPRNRNTSAAISPAPGGPSRRPRARSSSAVDDRDGEIGGGHDALVGPDRPQHGVGRVDPRRLLVPGVPVRQLAVQDALPDVAVERLVGARRLLQRGDAQRYADREQRPEDPACEPASAPEGRLVGGRDDPIAGGRGGWRRRRSRRSAAARCPPTTRHLVVMRRAMSPACRAT